MFETKIKNSTLRLEKGDLTLMNIEAIVFYAQNDLALGSGFGNAIVVRGGTSIQEELKELDSVSTCDVVITGAGELKSNYIIHAVGPKFQEKDTEDKLRTTMINTLKAADEKNISRVAFPPMGAGFYGIPLPVCAKVMHQSIKDYLANNTSIKEVVICTADNRELNAFHDELEGTT